VEENAVRPCRAAVLGCGSGTNAVYLASKGFDVTAIDIAPTALGLGEAKAQEANVRVKWLLADVLAMPELKPFDFIFDRGCYHNVRYVDAEAFIESVRRLSHPGTHFLVLSLDRDGPPGVREHHMRADFSALFDFEWLRPAGIHTGADGKNRRAAWSLMLRRKQEK
jgi:SAM-dependent methyltransferase